MSFHVGQRVVCVVVCDHWGGLRRSFPEVSLPVVGTVYTLRDVFAEPRCSQSGEVLVRLAELVNPPSKTNIGPYEAAFSSECFRPLDERRLDIFRAMLVSPPKEVIQA